MVRGSAAVKPSSHSVPTGGCEDVVAEWLSMKKFRPGVDICVIIRIGMEFKSQHRLLGLHQVGECDAEDAIFLPENRLVLVLLLDGNSDTRGTICGPRVGRTHESRGIVKVESSKDEIAKLAGLPSALHIGNRHSIGPPDFVMYRSTCSATAAGRGNRNMAQVLKPVDS